MTIIPLWLLSPAAVYCWWLGKEAFEFGQLALMSPTVPGASIPASDPSQREAPSQGVFLSCSPGEVLQELSPGQAA